MPSAILRSSVSLLVLLALTGCETTRQVGSDISSAFSGAGTYLDASDRCYAERSELVEHDSYFDETLVVATIGGALAGGVFSALTGGDVATGVLAGAVFGLATGYLATLQNEGLSADQITSRAVSDVARENRQIEALLVSFNKLADCRKGAGREVQARYDANEIDRATAEAEMAVIRGKYQEDVAKFREIATNVAKRSGNYAAIYNDIAADNGENALVVKDYTRGVQSATVAPAPATKVAGTDPGSLVVSEAKKGEVERLQSECLTNVQRRDDTLDRIEVAEQDAEAMSLDLG